MKMKIYSIYDVATEAYMRPFFLQSDSAAKRAFTDACIDPDGSINRHPTDYSLFKIGEFNDHTGEISKLPPTFIAQALQTIAETQRVDTTAQQNLALQLEKEMNGLTPEARDQDGFPYVQPKEIS